jgi:hypothetical protein
MDEHPFTTSNVILVLIGFPWSVLLLLDQLGLLDPLLKAIGV